MSGLVLTPLPPEDFPLRSGESLRIAFPVNTLSGPTVGPTLGL